MNGAADEGGRQVDEAASEGDGEQGSLEESMGILELLKQRRVYFDGGTGSLLQERGLKPGELPETWNLRRPEVIKELHREYLNAGADVITMNTFGVNRFKFKGEKRGNAESACGSGGRLRETGDPGLRTRPYGS